jgi:methanogenic corrinoid protein MtbC1
MEAVKEQTLRAMESLDLDALNIGVRTLVEQGCESLEIQELLQQGMKLVGEQFARGEYFLSDLIVSGMMFKSALSLFLTETQYVHPDSSQGKVLIGVMAGDIHDIGKDIIVQILKTENYDILDLGVDVPAEAFVKAAEKFTPDVIALSGIMGNSALEMKRVVKALAEAGIHPGTPVVVGGTCVSELVVDNIGAVSYARGPVDIVLFCKNVLASKKKP